MPKRRGYFIPENALSEISKIKMNHTLLMLKEAKWVDLSVRINGESRMVQADWLKHIEKVEL